MNNEHPIPAPRNRCVYIFMTTRIHITHTKCSMVRRKPLISMILSGCFNHM